MASPPPPPPKSGAFSPSSSQYGPPAPPAPHRGDTHSSLPSPVGPAQHAVGSQPFAPAPQVLEEQWLPSVLKAKSKSDLEAALHNPTLLTSLLHAPSTAHPSLPASQESIQTQLQANIALAQHVLALEGQIQTLRGTLAPGLVRVAALERQFRAKQEEMDEALSPWAPKAVHTRLGRAVGEQDAWCAAMEESFLEGEGDGRAGDREVAEWVRRYREGRKALELRREKRARLEEGRVGGWR